MALKIMNLYWVSEYTQQQPELNKKTGKWKTFPPVLKSRRLAVVTDGQYYGSNGGISNMWSWTYLDENKKLSKETASGYANGFPYDFEIAGEYVLRIEAVEKTK